MKYAESNKETLFNFLADYVELLDFRKMTLNSYKIENKKIQIIGVFLALFKLQDGTAEDIASGSGQIREEIKSFDYSVVVDGDFNIIQGEDGPQITIKLQTS